MSETPPPGTTRMAAIVSDDFESRRADLQKVWLVSGGGSISAMKIADPENALILNSAQSSYVHGIDVGAVIAAHASCERDLLIRATHWTEEGEREPPRGFEMWGLGKLLKHYRADIPSHLFTKIEALNVRRRTLYHYGHSHTETGVGRSVGAYVERHGYGHLAVEYERIYQCSPGPKQMFEFASKAMLRSWALEALEAAYGARTWAGR